MTMQSKSRSYAVLLLVSFFSGMNCLIYELIWSRYLNLIFGVSVYAVATVLACFMLGLAAGSWHIGRLIDRRGNGLRVLLWLEVGIGVYLVLSPLIYGGMAQLTVWIFQTVQTENQWRNVIRFFIAMVALIVPTYLMGGTFPAFIKAISRQEERIGRDVGIVYAVNTLGGVVGVFVTGFILVERIGLSKTLYLAAGISLAVAGVVAVLLRDAGQDGGEIAMSKGKAPKHPPRRRGASVAPATPVYSRGLVWLVLAVCGLSGFTSLAYEVYWTKILTYFFRDTIYDLTIVLTAFLCGIVIGSAAIGKLSRKIRNPALWLAVVEIGTGLSTLLGLFLIARLPFWINDLQTNAALVSRYGESFWAASVAIRFGYAFCVMLVPTILLGAAFPLAGRICAGSLQHLGGQIGLMSGINTAGATAGALAAAIVFMPLLGIQHSLALMALLNVAAGLALVTVVPLVRRRLRHAIAYGGGGITLVLIAFLPQWDQRRMSTSFLEPSQPLEQLLDLQYYREDAHGITAVVELIPLKRKYLTTNRLYSHNTSVMMGLEDHRRLGQIPVLLHPNPQEGLVIGLGAGITLRGVADGDLKRIDCVEISRSVIEAARYFERENAGVIDNPRVRFIVDDGRNYVRTTSAKYDVIVGDILFPMSSESSNIFSREYFAQGKARLQPSGLFCQWLPVHQLSREELRIIVQTFRTVFEHTSLWYGMVGEGVPVIGCIGTEARLAIDWQGLGWKYRNTALVGELREVNLQNPYMLLSHFIMADGDVEAFCKGVRINTDDCPIVEFLAPRHSVQSQRLGTMNLLEISGWVKDVSPFVNWCGAVPALPPEIAAQLKAYQEGKKVIIRGIGMALDGDAEGQARVYREGLAKDPGNADLRYSLQQCERQ